MGSAQLNPVKMTTSLVKIACRRGAQIFEEEEIIAFSTGPKSVIGFVDRYWAREGR